MKPKTTLLASCTCGSTKFEATGVPIVTVVCYCGDCQAGSRRIEALPNAPPVREPDGGTAYLLFRKDRLTCVMGGEFLRDLRIRESSPTKRVVASCCNSAMFLNFERGHWLSIYQARFEGDVPPVQMRIQSKFKPEGTVMPKDAPAYASFPFKFIAKLMAARLAMLLHR
jgi:hypothetical protein